MTSERKPSVYSDRGNYGSAEELDEYGVWIKCEPQDMSLTDSDDLDTAGLSAPDFEDSAYDTIAHKSFDPSEMGEIELSDGNFSMESDDNLPGVEALAEEGSLNVNFDEFPITGDAVDTTSLVSENDFEVPTVETIEASSRVKESDISNQLLQKIANELSSIRNELAEMKKEFAIVRAAVPAGEAKEDDQRVGFFSEEEDETIALTGDELNNILNTADFTEESGANETPDEPPADTASTDGASLDEENTEAQSGDELIQIDLDSLGIDLNPDVPAIEEVPTVEDLPMEATEEDALEKLRTEGAVPINPVPDNVSYLEESEIADVTDDASINSSSFDLNEVAIDESELAAIGLEDNLTEPVSDNIAGDDIDISSLDDLTVASDGIEIEEAALGETADDNLESITDISIEAQSDDGHDIVLPMPEESLDIDMLTDDSLDISIPEDDFATPTDDGIDSLSATEESLDIDMLTDDSLDISIPEDDFTVPPIAEGDLSMSEDEFAMPAAADDDLSIPEDEFAALPAADDITDNLSAPEEILDTDMLTDDSLDISIPEDDFAVPPIADDDLSMPEDEFATPAVTDDDLSIPEDDFTALPAVDDAADILSTPEENLDIDMLTDDNLDISIPEDDFASSPITDDGADSLPMPEESAVMDMLSDDSIDLSMPEDGFAAPADDDFAALPSEADDFSMPATDDGLSMPDDDFSMPAADDGFTAPTDDDFASPSMSDDNLPRSKDRIENIIPEDFEAGIKDSPVPFDDDLKDDLAVQEMSSLLGTTSKVRPEKRVTRPVARDVPSENEASDKKKGKESDLGISPTLKNELKTVLSYMDRLLDSLPEEKIAEFAKSEYFDSYKKLFKELGLV